MIVLWAGGGNSCPFVSKRLHWPSVKKSKSALGVYIRMVSVKISQTPSMMLSLIRSWLLKYSATCYCMTSLTLTRNIEV